MAIVTAACLFAAKFLPRRLVQTAEIHLFVSFWAPPTDKVVPHRAEVEAAIAVNLANLHISALHVLLETTEDFGCPDAQTAIFSRMARSAALLQRARFVCREFITKVSYYDMFTESIKATPWNAIAIVANADQVFDETLRNVRSLSSHIVGVVSTRGFDPHLRLSAVTQYKSLMGKSGQARPLRCVHGIPRMSWDAFIFKVEQARVQREWFTDEESGEPFPMNQNGAENAALNGLLATSHFKKAFNLCDYVHLWHFHSEASTHVNSSEKFVAHMYSTPDACLSLHGCTHLENRW